MVDKCRRRWDLADCGYLKYKYMQAFDRAMNHLDKAFGFVNTEHTWVSRKDDEDKIIICERGNLVFVFNFHPTQSYAGYRVGCKTYGPYKVVLSSDEAVFGGRENVTKNSDIEYWTAQGDGDENTYYGRPYSFQVDVPSLTAVVYAPSKFCSSTADSLPTGIPGLGVEERGPSFAF